MKKVIIVLGMHRSGTSLAAQICRCMGGYLGEENELMAANEANLDGYFENIEIVDIDDSILELCGKKWYSVGEPEMNFHSRQIIKAMEKLEAVLKKLLQKAGTVVIKDPRIPMLLPLWGRVLEGLGVRTDYVWVIRNPLEVAESLMKRDGYSREHGLWLWIQYNFSILKYLNGKEYLLLNYQEMLGNYQAFQKISKIFDRELDENLKQELSHILKHEYYHSKFLFQDVINMHNKLLSDLYYILLNGKSIREAVGWEKRYKEEIPKIDGRYIDYMALKNVKCLEDKKIVIYGAGNCGKEAAKMLIQLNFCEFDFCDRDNRKHGMTFMGGKVLSIVEIEEKDNLLVIIAVKDKQARKEVEQTLMCRKGLSFLSFFTLKRIWEYLE